MAADSVQAADDVRDVGAEDPAICVDLVDDYVAEVAEEPAPSAVVWEDTLVEHVGVREDDARLAPQLSARGLRSVAVVGAGFDHVRQRGFQLGVSAEAAKLVLGQGLGGKEIERRGISGLRISDCGLPACWRLAALS